MRRTRLPEPDRTPVYDAAGLARYELQPGETIEYRLTPQRPFRAKVLLVIESNWALQITRCHVGNERTLAGVAANTFKTYKEVNWPVANVGNQVCIEIENIGDEPAWFQATLEGESLGGSAFYDKREARRVDMKEPPKPVKPPTPITFTKDTVATPDPETGVCANPYCNICVPRHKQPDAVEKHGKEVSRAVESLDRGIATLPVKSKPAVYEADEPGAWETPAWDDVDG